ncbi:hypothetical protein [Xanthomonas oryzae]|uniref:hypothetical protein n=1 Tax=Xanthomonas oryzae TaxID=347 RepID=UPI0004673362|nr:hypothetical protein [Xanthomonas oryzae]ALS96055.1 hypothetical protein AXO1947_17685 [Xanthomonas oryzae pv. oryzae]AUI89458.1 hypothetical protein BVV16_03140 [Xanthomonas oryzae pv. oryzae]AUI93134.1 hypothetical protein BVV17_03140 [Xanthomonas oryzae pv. oryzae]AUI96804.1 hypothetical protein BVV18_03145 [Xanthomonas oryzae pv. oryzae]AUJ00476.1 hypothetical protein BVV10_03145 [Xanthomonas oryzae pv. oryzae]
MDQLLTKITNLSYEIWGIFVPGLIMLLFFLFTWWCAGAVAGIVTFGFVAPAEVKTVTGFIGLLNNEVKIGFIAGLAVAAYFAGHLLHWISSSPKDKSKKFGSIERVISCLRLSIPKSAVPYDDFLEKQLSESKEYLSMPAEATWPEFYPVAKAFLASRLQSSLVTTYQNKYTLHRSLTAAAVVWFWLNIIVLMIGACFCYFGIPAQPKWFPTIAAPFFAIALIYGFSDSYQYNWKLFGSTLISRP